MADVLPQALQMLKRRAKNERAGEMREHPAEIRRALIPCFISLRTKEVTDDVIRMTDDVIRMMMEMIHRIESLTERQLEREIHCQSRDFCRKIKNRDVPRFDDDISHNGILGRNTCPAVT
jgi:hypothetical protein